MKFKFRRIYAKQKLRTRLRPDEHRRTPLHSSGEVSGSYEEGILMASLQFDGFAQFKRLFVTGFSPVLQALTVNRSCKAEPQRTSVSKHKDITTTSRNDHGPGVITHAMHHEMP